MVVLDLDFKFMLTPTIFPLLPFLGLNHMDPIFCVVLASLLTYRLV